MPRSLPPSPSLETLRKQAKVLRRAHKQGDTSALPDLDQAFTDHLERFPSVLDGLGSIDMVVLAGAEKLGRVRIARLIGECLGSGLAYLSDTLAAKHARDMASCRDPLLRPRGRHTSRRACIIPRSHQTV